MAPVAPLGPELRNTGFPSVLAFSNASSDQGYHSIFWSFACRRYADFSFASLFNHPLSHGALLGPAPQTIIRSFYKKHLAFRAFQDVEGNSAHVVLRDPGPAPRGDHDKVYALFPFLLQYGLIGSPVLHVEVKLDFLCLRVFIRLFPERLVGPFRHLFLELVYLLIAQAIVDMAALEFFVNHMEQTDPA